MQTEQTHITELLQDCKQGSTTAQFEIYKLYYKAMFNTAMRILQNSYDAEDVMQEAFLTAFTKLQTYKSEVAFGAWLKRIVINKSLTQLKRHKRYQEVKMEVIPTNEIEEEVIDYRGLKPKNVINCLQNLKENYRIVLTLNLIEGFDYEEIAQILNYTNENVRTTVSRAKKKLKQALLADNIQEQAYGR